MKIIDKINAILEADEQSGEKTTSYSFEYFPPKTSAGEENLIERIVRMGNANPLWVDVTWRAGEGLCESTIEMCSHITKYLGLDVLMHITCTGMTREYIIDALNRAKEAGVRNILALRGDPPHGKEDWEPVENGFTNATQIVQFIKKEFGDWFCIVVAGYPEVHLQATSREDDIKYLKEKCDAGSDIIITQLFFNNEIYLEWVKDCRAAGIKAHIIPGIMPILGYDRFAKTVKYCKTNVPAHLKEALEPLKNDDEKVREFGVNFCVQQSQELMDAGTRFLHYYTMNLETAVIKVIQKLNIIRTQKQLPFQTNSAERENEDVRPIFWQNKPTSYIEKTQTWDEFPNGRWGDSRSPAFNNDDGFVSYSKKFKNVNAVEKRKMWGQQCRTMEDISTIFVKYLQGKIKKFPFSEGSIALETADICQILISLNANKLFTINSQPSVNAAKSDHPKYGWGPENGYVYQKAYFEMFVHPDVIEILVKHLDKHEDVSYQAINLQGQTFQNVKDNDVNAVTWGVFRGREVIQPTVVDHQAFKLWKNEALTTFVDIWAAIYKVKIDKDGNETGDQKSIDFLKECKETFYLINIVDNNFVDGTLTEIMLHFICQNNSQLNGAYIECTPKEIEDKNDSNISTEGTQ